MPFLPDSPVNEQIQRLWCLELKMAEVLLRICQKHDLHIWACFGTLLGAVRHNGFIPWDDDLDFVMMRPDYDRLIQLCKQGKMKESLPNNYIFDLEDISVIKLRCSNTTAIIPSYSLRKEFNQGVWIDVFCLDVAPDDITSSSRELVDLKKKIRLFRNRKFSYYAMMKSLRFVIRHAMIRILFLFCNLEGFRNEIENSFRDCENRFSGKVVWPFLICSLAKDVFKIPRYEVSWFKYTVMLPFENLKLPCPVGWDALLTSQYGDWRTPIRGGSLHEGVEIDLNRSYVEVINEKLNNLPLWKRYMFTH